LSASIDFAPERSAGESWAGEIILSPPQVIFIAGLIARYSPSLEIVGWLSS
jgi:hypothetical protein